MQLTLEWRINHYHQSKISNESNKTRIDCKVPRNQTHRLRTALKIKPIPTRAFDCTNPRTIRTTLIPRRQWLCHETVGFAAASVEKRLGQHRKQKKTKRELLLTFHNVGESDARIVTIASEFKTTADCVYVSIIEKQMVWIWSVAIMSLKIGRLKRTVLMYCWCEISFFFDAQKVML